MDFKLVYPQEALYQLRKLENATVKRIADKLDEASEDPLHFFERLAGREEYKLRVGDYRVLARILVNDKTIFVLSVGHRKNVYKD